MAAFARIGTLRSDQHGIVRDDAGKTINGNTLNALIEAGLVERSSSEPDVNGRRVYIFSAKPTEPDRSGLAADLTGCDI